MPSKQGGWAFYHLSVEVQTFHSFSSIFWAPPGLLAQVVGADLPPNLAVGHRYGEWAAVQSHPLELKQALSPYRSVKKKRGRGHGRKKSGPGSRRPSGSEAAHWGQTDADSPTHRKPKYRNRSTNVLAYYSNKIRPLRTLHLLPMAKQLIWAGKGYASQIINRSLFRDVRARVWRMVYDLTVSWC